MIVDGQVHGGVAQGIAQALYEEAVYDDDGNLVTGTMVDYLVPAPPDLPAFVTDRTETPATTNPLGVKGVGEAGTIASTPAVVNAVVDAVRHFGVDDVRMPCTPERVWRAIHQGGGGGERRRRGDGRLRRRRRPRRRREVGRHDSGGVRLRARRVGRRRGVRAGRARRRGQGDGRRAEPAAADAAAPGGPGGRRRRRPGRPTCAASARTATPWSSARMTTHHEVMHDELVRQHCGLLAEATETVADPAVRHRGTFGGSLAHADPAGDLPAVALALGAEMVVGGPQRAADDPGRGVLRRLPGDGAVAGRAAGRGAGAEARRRAGASATRSSTGSRRPGRSWASPRRCAGTTGRSPRRASG